MMRGSPLRRFTLTRVLVLLFSLVGLVPLVAFGLYAIQVGSDHLVRITLQDLKQSVLSDAHNIQHRVDMAQGDLPILSQLSEMQELVRAKAGKNQIEIALAKPPVEQAFLAFSSNRKVYNQIRYLDENGQEVVRVDYDGTHPPRLIPRERLQNKRQRDYFSETMKLAVGQVYTSPLDLNREDDQIEIPYRPVIRYATSLFDDAGRRRGIVTINLMAGPLLDALYQETKAARKVVYAVDQEGFYLLHPDPAKQWGGPRDLNTGERIQRDLPDLASRLLSRHAVAMVMGEQVITSQSLALSVSRSGPSIVIFERMPKSVVLAAVADLHLYLLIFLVGVGVVAVMGAVLIGEKLARPIVALEKAALQIQQGELEAKVEAGGSHEIATLGDTFNAMAENLAQSRGQIQEVLHRVEEASRHKSAFLATMSHELRTPLNSILGSVALLQQQAYGPLTAKQARYVTHIHRSSEHLLALFNDLLDLSKVEVGKLDLRPEVFDLREALIEVLTEFRPRVEAKGLTLQLQVKDLPSALSTDPIRFKQILHNLLSNAVKFTPAGGAVTVTAKMVLRSEFGVSSSQPETASAREIVEIVVQDTGVGIKAEDLPKLFQMFTQLEPFLTRQHEGTGIGLALTKRLVELHGGTIWAASDGEGRGSTFTVRLPVGAPGETWRGEDAYGEPRSTPRPATGG